MFTLDGVRKFHDWTHSSLSRMLDHIATLPEGSYHTKLNGFGFATIGEQVLHIFQCETNWIHRAQAIPFDGLSVSEYPAILEARVLQRKVRSETSAYLSGLTEQQLNEEITLRSYDGLPHARLSCSRHGCALSNSMNRCFGLRVIIPQPSTPPTPDSAPTAQAACHP
jgi:uncharacterized damage-inducible protein DinB